MTSGKSARTTSGVTRSSPPALVPHKRSPRQTIFLIWGTRHNSCLSLSNMFQFPVSRWNCSNKRITSSRGNHGVPHSLDTTKPVSYHPWLFTLFPSAPHTWLCVHIPQAVRTCDNKLLLILSVAEYQDTPVTLGWESLPHPQDEEEMIKIVYRDSQEKGW